MDQRVKFKCRRDGARIVVDVWFDDCQLGSTTVMSGDLRIALDVENGTLRLNEKSQLVYSDGEPYHRFVPTREEWSERKPFSIPKHTKEPIAQR